MATQRKPAASTTRKSTTARKTTTTRKTPAKKDTPNASATTDSSVSVPEPSYTPEQRQALLDTYFAFSNAGLEIPENVKVVEKWIVDQQDQDQQRELARQDAESRQVARANVDGPWYVRNKYPAPFNFRLDRQTEKRRIELKQRGVPGDMHPLKDEDLKDPILIANVNTGLIEIIPAGEAQLIIEKQTHNSGQRVHTPLAVIQQEYAQHARDGMNVNPNPQFKVESEFNAQGVTVAYTDPNVLQGNLTDTQVKRSPLGGLTRPGAKQQVPQVHSAFVPTGGNPAIVSSGHSNIQADIARRAQGQKEAQLHPGPGQLTVTVAPTERT